MTDDELAEWLADCPVLYHMAEAGSWPSIRTHGLLSTSALLDLFHITGPDRCRLESQRRPEGMLLTDPTLGQALVRDQKPMDDDGLRRCLKDGLSPQVWYRMLNRRVYFWLTQDRLIRLLEAKPYRDKPHDVLALDARSLIDACRDRITLSPINSGATKPFPAPRGKDTFLPIAAYPYAAWRAKRPKGERVVELTVTDRVPDPSRFVLSVTEMRGRTVLRTLA
jgi:hypothetical protein